MRQAVRIALGLIICIFCYGLSAQTVDWQWVKHAGGAQSDTGQSIVTDSNGNSYIIGDFIGSVNFGTFTLTSSVFNDIFIAKMDVNGNWLWAKKAGGSSSEYGTAIAIDGNGNCYVTGFFTGTSIFGETSLISSGSADIFIAKLDSNGNWLWAKKGCRN